MVKATKKQPVNHGKPITSFFSKAPKPPASSPSVPSSSQGTPSSRKDNQNTNVQASLNTRIKNATELEALDSAWASTVPSGRSKTDISMQADAAYLKRARSPDSLFSSPLVFERPQTPGPPRAEIGKADIDLDTINTPNPQQKKKARMLTSDVSNRIQPVRFVPSSQSDEELPAMDSEPDVGPISCRESSITDDESNHLMDMDVDEDKTEAQEAARGSWSPSNELSSRTEAQTPDLFSTPPSSDAPPMPPTPVALDAASKTAKIIADIKARALAKSMSSPEPALPEFIEELESSSDEEGILSVLPVTRKNLPSFQEEKPQKPIESSTRYALRNRASASPSRGSRSRASSSKMPVDKLPTRTTATGARTKPKPPPDPFAALLKEKKLAAKRGHDTDAFRLAEIAASNLVKNDLDDDFDLDDGDQADWRAATQAARNSNWLVNKAASPETKKVGGQAILDILEQDLASKDEIRVSEKIPGIKIWSTAATDSAMQVDDDHSVLISGHSPIVRLLNTFLRRRDHSRAATIMNVPLMLSVDEVERSAVASSLCNILSSPVPDILAEQVTRVLGYFWSSTLEPVSSTIYLSNIIQVFHMLDMDPDILSSQRWSDRIDAAKVCDPLRRPKAVANLVGLISACAKSRRLKREEIPDILTAILLLGMDFDATKELLQDISLTVHEICQSVSPDDLKFNLLLLSRLVDCVQHFDAINKLRFLSFLSGGAGHTRRIANLLAHCIITDKIPSEDMLSELPSLLDIIEQLQPYSKSSGKSPGKFALHDETDYIDLGFYVSILAVAVSNIREYVVQERRAKHTVASHQSSPSIGGERPKTDLQLLHTALEALHSKIADTRATHLERSRTKAIIKGLTMNIYYQREFWLKNDTDTRAKTLAQYFKKKDRL